MSHRGGSDAQHRHDVEHGTTGGAATDEVDEVLKTRTMDGAPVGITVADATEPDMPLVYVNAAFGRITGYPPERAVGRNCRFLQGEATRHEPVDRMRAAIEADESVSVELQNYRRDGELFWNEVTLAPLRNGDGEVTHYIGFQQDVTQRKRAELAAARRAARIERERATQERLLARVDGVVVDVTAAVAGAKSRSALERAVVERLAATYAGAWIGNYDPAEAAVVPRVTAGTVAGDDGEPDPVPIADDRAPGDAVTAAVAAAVEHRAVRIESMTDATTGAVKMDVAALPLHYGDATYGAACVYAPPGTDFDAHERAVLTALGRTVATGINSLESQRTLRAEETVELRFSLRTHPLIGLAENLGGRLEYVRSVADRDRPSALFELEDIGVDEVRSATAASPVDIQAVLFEGSDGCLIEFALPDGKLRNLLADHGADLREATVEGRTGRFTVDVAREPLARSLADAVLDRFDGANLIGYRQRERHSETRREFVARLERDLTDRQHAALVRAYAGGFFEWPHETTGEDIAETMDICRSTFHQHLRAAQRKLIGTVLDPPADPN